MLIILSLYRRAAHAGSLLLSGVARSARLDIASIAKCDGLHSITTLCDGK
jgi:hypothetical protein